MRTSKPEYIEPIIQALTELRTAYEDNLLEQAFTLIRDRLYKDDYTVLPNGEPRWRNQMQHMLDGLIESGRIEKKDGLLRLTGS